MSYKKQLLDLVKEKGIVDIINNYIENKKYNKVINDINSIKIEQKYRDFDENLIRIIKLQYRTIRIISNQDKPEENMYYLHIDSTYNNKKKEFNLEIMNCKDYYEEPHKIIFYNRFGIKNNTLIKRNY